MQLELVEPQRLMVEHLRKCDDALLFCGMGLGKSAAVLERLNELFLSGDSVAALIIGPLRVINITWINEVKQWDKFSWMRLANLRTEHGQRCFLQGSAHIYLINFESIPLLVSLVERRKNKLPYDTLVIDELTKSKNPGSKRINLFRRKISRVARHYGLTGTPMPNSELDLFAQVRLIDGGKRLGTSSTDFKKNYFYAPEYQFAPWKPKAETHRLLEEKISDITISLKSSDWLSIPDTVIEDVDIVFPPALREQYTTLEKELVIELKQGKTINVANSAALITKLLQFTSGEMYCNEGEHHPIHELKFDAVKRIIKDEKQPIFIACAFKHEYVRMKQHFPNSVFFNDAKTPESQQQLMRDWNAKKVPILFAHPASTGHGLNFQFGSSVLVFISLTYNREYYDQTIARFARRGQTEITKVYRLMVSETVDWAVAESLQQKSNNEARLISALQMLESFRAGGNGK